MTSEILDITPNWAEKPSPNADSLFSKYIWLTLIAGYMFFWWNFVEFNWGDRNCLVLPFTSSVRESGNNGQK